MRIPGIADSQPRRRNPVNVPRTWRGTRVLPSTGVALVGRSLTGSSSTASLSVGQALLQRAVPGIADSVARRRNPVNAPRTWRGTRVSDVAPPATLLQHRTPGIGGQAKRRGPVNAPRTWRGTRIQVIPPALPAVTLGAGSFTGSSAAAVFFVAYPTTTAISTTGSLSTTTPPLTGSSRTGSVSFAVLHDASRRTLISNLLINVARTPRPGGMVHDRRQTVTAGYFGSGRRNQNG